MVRDSTALLLAGVLVAVATSAEARSLSGPAESDQALVLCMRAEGATGTEKLALLDRGLALAEQEIAADDTDATAHFAVFCNLGRQIQLRPLGLGSLRAVRRLRREVDRALELAPDAVDVLTAKGTFLLELPRFLGGDAAEAEHLLRRAVDLDPGYAYARFALARLLLERNERDAAAAQVRAAMAATEESPDSSQAAEAQTLLASIEH